MSVPVVAAVPREIVPAVGAPRLLGAVLPVLLLMEPTLMAPLWMETEPVKEFWPVRVSVPVPVLISVIELAAAALVITPAKVVELLSPPTVNVADPTEFVIRPPRVGESPDSALMTGE